MAYDLKNEDEVKEYLENLSTEYMFQCYHEKKADGCHRYADFHEAVKKDFSEAAKIFKFNCDDYNYGHSCFKYAGYKLLGKGVEKDEKQAFKYYGQSCKNEYIQGCHALAMMYGSGIATGKKDWVKAKDIFHKNCAKGFVESCYFLSTLYLTGKGEVPKDLKRAFDISVKACEMGNIYACSNVGLMYRKGDGVEKNIQLGNEYQQKAKKMRDEMTKQQDALTFSE